MEYYNKAIELNPKYADAYLNMAALVLEKDQAIIEKMNTLGNSAADNKKYDQFKLDREKVLKEAMPFLEKTIEFGNKEIEVKRTLMNIYYTLDMTDKYKKLKAEVDGM
ncbi:MAG: tetratricopeptide repeat protein [Flavobacterium sp.]